MTCARPSTETTRQTWPIAASSAGGICGSPTVICATCRPAGLSAAAGDCAQAVTDPTSPMTTAVANPNVALYESDEYAAPSLFAKSDFLVHITGIIIPQYILLLMTNSMSFVIDIISTVVKFIFTL
jgi:hypothetical protein